MQIPLKGYSRRYVRPLEGGQCELLNPQTAVLAVNKHDFPRYSRVVVVPDTVHEVVFHGF